MADAGTSVTVPEVYLPLINTLKTMFEKPKHSDLTVVCGDRKWSVHKDIVCGQSPFFAKACQGGFKVGIYWCAEAQEHAITLIEDDPSVVDAMLRYMYTMNYNDAADDQVAYTSIVFNVHVHNIADKYDVPPLAKLAEMKFGEQTKVDWRDPAFADAAWVVYTSGADRDRKLRTSVVDVASKNAKALYREEFGSRFREVASSTGLGSDVAQRLAAGCLSVHLPSTVTGAAAAGKQFKCQDCGRSFDTCAIGYRPDGDLYCVYCGSPAAASRWYSWARS